MGVDGRLRVHAKRRCNWSPAGRDPRCAERLACVLVRHTKPDQIARIVLENTRLLRANAIRDALTRAIDTVERKEREKSMLSG
jgi:hypothetical protein